MTSHSCLVHFTIFRFVTIRPIKTKTIKPGVTLNFIAHYQGQASDSALSEMETRHELLAKRDAYLEKCDDVRNQLATLLFEKGSRHDEDKTIEDLYHLVDDDATTLATLTDLLQTMQTDTPTVNVPNSVEPDTTVVV